MKHSQQRTILCSIAACQALLANGGFLGGASWAIFLACIMSEYKTELAGHLSFQETVHRLALSFFDEASRWPWPQPISLQIEPENAQSQPRMVVLTSLKSNLAKNSTISTCSATATEQRRKGLRRCFDNYSCPIEATRARCYVPFYHCT